MSYFATYEPNLVLQCKARRLQRCCFWSAGVNDLWAIDQHDKWLRFGLGLHTGIEPFSGRIMWIRVWHSNRNPQLILSYYLDVVEELQHRSVSHLNEKTQLACRHSIGDSKWSRDGKLWHCKCANNATTMAWPDFTRNPPASVDAWKKERQAWDNMVSTSTTVHSWVRKYPWPWCNLRMVWHRQYFSSVSLVFAYYFSLCSISLTTNDYRMIFHWVFIPWLQQELNAYQDRINNTAKCHDQNKVSYSSSCPSSRTLT